MKRNVLVLIIFILILITTGCNEEKNTDLTIVLTESQEKDFTIIKNYIKDFENKYKINVKLLKIKETDVEKYFKKINTKLYLKNGPTLIYVPNFDYYQQYINSKVAIKLKDKIYNYKYI
ncbi:MAG: hypothetical protein FH751_16475 [Firmicutes bacterium]|nr:hypothetical protein [Bacillota bacterium]